MSGKVVAACIVLIFIIALLIPQFVDISAEQIKKEEGYVHLENIEIKAEKVNESHASIKFIISIYRSEILSNATLTISIYDRITDLLVNKIKIGIPEKGDEGVAELNTTISFEKNKDYNINFRLEKDKRVVDSRGMSLRGLDTLIPKEKELKMTLKDVDFEIASVRNNTATIKARFYIETMEDYSDVTFHIKAIQYESNVLADDDWLDVNVKKGKTLLVESNLTVPKDYNYLVKIEVWRNGSLLKTWSKALNLAPTKKVPENVTEEEVKFKVSEFVKDRFITPTPLPMPTPTPPMVGDIVPEKATPGFEVVLALIATGGVLLWKRR